MPYDLYRSIIDNANTGFACLRALNNEDGIPVDYDFVQVNPAFTELIEAKAEAILGRSIRTVLSHLIPREADMISIFNEVCMEGSRESCEQYSKTLNKWYWVYLYQPMPGYLVVMLNDISEKKIAEENLRESEARWKFALEGSGDGLWDWDFASNRVFYSRQCKAMLGFQEDEFVPHLNEWDRRLHPEDREPVYAAIEEHSRGETPYYISEHRLLCKDGTYKWILDRGMIVSRDPEGKPLRAIGTHSDISRRKKIEAELQQKNQQLEEINEILRQQAISDSLTQLFNHRYVMEKLQSEINRTKRYHQPLSIMMMDLDHFKRINDNYGHQIGDEVLSQTAEIIRSNLRNTDTAGRYGGEEFMVVLPQTALPNSLQVAERIRRQIEQTVFQQPDLRITISIGVTEYHDDDLESLLKRVDNLLYAAKNKGRNRIESLYKKE